MTTKYLVRLADTTAGAATGHETTVRCTCGWSMTLSGETRAMALQVAGKARTNHLEDAHPDQVVGSPVAALGHDLLIGGSTRTDHRWTRQAVCACGWTDSVTERTPDRVAAIVRSRHRDHLVHETGRAPVRDYVVMLALLAVVAVVMVGLFAAATTTGGV